MMIHSAFILNKWLDGRFAEDRNSWLVDYWDEKLTENPRLFAVAVNDWYGASSSLRFSEQRKWAIDTGKQILLTPEKTSAAAKEAFRRGAMFALVDKGQTKGNYPDITGIDVGIDFIRINADADVRWISGGEEIATGTDVDLKLVGNRNHIRAEISNESSVIYTQPWEIGHCDFDLDADCDLRDIDALLRIGDLSSGVHVITGINDHLELTDDGRLDQRDIDVWLAEAGRRSGFDAHFSRGDSNLDGIVDASDLNNLALHWLVGGAWSEGDFNGDGRTDGADLNQLAVNWHNSLALRDAPVPAPATYLLAVSAAVFFLARRCHGREVRTTSQP